MMRLLFHVENVEDSSDPDNDLLPEEKQIILSKLLRNVAKKSVPLFSNIMVKFQREKKEKEETNPYNFGVGK